MCFPLLSWVAGFPSCCGFILAVLAYLLLPLGCWCGSTGERGWQPRLSLYLGGIASLTVLHLFVFGIKYCCHYCCAAVLFVRLGDICVCADAIDKCLVRADDVGRCCRRGDFIGGRGGGSFSEVERC